MIVGITGTMSAGKSTVTKLIEKAGHRVYDTDKMVHKYYDLDGLLYKDLVELFGQDILKSDKNINRAKLGNLVFNDDKLLDALEKLVFPRVLDEMKELSGNRDTLIFFEVPLLFEANMESFFDKIIVVDAKEDLRISRALNKGLARDDINKRMNRQFTAAKKRLLADYIIENNFDLESLKEEVQDVLEIIKLERGSLWMKK